MSGVLPGQFRTKQQHHKLNKKGKHIMCITVRRIRKNKNKKIRCIILIYIMWEFKKNATKKKSEVH